jgi:hypothetical protein
MSLLRVLPAAIGLAVSIVSVVAAQDAVPPAIQKTERTVTTDRFRMDGQRRRGILPRKRLFSLQRRNGLNQLNLSDEQRQQRRTILQRHLTEIKGKREQMFELRQKRIEGSFTAEDRARAKTIRQELRTSMEGIRGEMLNSLTRDQRVQLDSLREQRKQRREEIMKRRQELRKTRTPQ